MMKLLWIMVMFVGSLWATDATLAAKHLGAEQNYAQAVAKARNTGKMLVMVVVKEHCRWCQKLVDRTLSDPKVQKRLGEEFVTLIVDKDDTYPATFKEGFFPSIFYIDPKTEQSVYENVGYVGVKCFINDLDGAIKTRHALYDQ